MRGLKAWGSRVTIDAKIDLDCSELYYQCSKIELTTTYKTGRRNHENEENAVKKRNRWKKGQKYEIVSPLPLESRNVRSSLPEMGSKNVRRGGELKEMMQKKRRNLNSSGCMRDFYRGLL